MPIPKSSNLSGIFVYIFSPSHILVFFIAGVLFLKLNISLGKMIVRLRTPIVLIGTFSLRIYRQMEHLSVLYLSFI